MAKRKKVSRLTAELLETVNGMHEAGLLDRAAFEKITMRHLGKKLPSAPVLRRNSP
jgi:putative transcriptional regulator